jgi:hypothetical protein
VLDYSCNLELKAINVVQLQNNIIIAKEDAIRDINGPQLQLVK